MAKIRTKWYEYCDNCSYRTKVRQIGTEYEISCDNCPKVVITDDLSKKPE